MAAASLLDHFSPLADPRQSWKVVYPLRCRDILGLLTAWGASLADSAPEIVAIDGKTSCRAHGIDAHPLHVVSA